MGDRTTVHYTFRKSDLVSIIGGLDKEKLKEFEEKMDASSLDVNENTIDIEAYDVNYASWKEVEAMIAEHNLEYDCWWAAGGDYGAGTKTGRIINGSLNEYETYEMNDSLEHYLEEVLKKVSEGISPDEIVKECEARLKELVPFKPKTLEEPNSLQFIKSDVDPIQLEE
jgi:hypothetical protein